MTNIDPEVARFIRDQARRAERQNLRMQSIAAAPSDLRHSALDGAPLVYKDPEGNVIGTQGYDAATGSMVTQHHGGQRPPRPVALFVDTGGETVKIQHSGADINGLPAPANVRHGIVHASQEADFEPGPGTFAGYLEPIDGSLTHRLPGGEWHFGVVWRSQSGLESDMSEITTADIAPLVDTSDLEETLAEAEQIIADAVAAAQLELDELRDRLDNFEEYDSSDLVARINQVTEDLADARQEAAGLVADLADQVDGIKIPDVSGFVTQTEVDAAAAAAEIAAKEHADLVAQGAEDNAIAEAETKANAAQAAAEAAAKAYTDQQDAATLQTAAEDATAKADAAQAAAEAEADRLAKAEAQAAEAEAIRVAAADALAQANAARDAAISSASTDATAKAEAAQAAAVVYAEAEAQAKADAAQAEAIRQAAEDATAKANKAREDAEAAANSYADRQDAQVKIDAAADAQEKADAVLSQASDLMARAITQGQNLIVDGSFEEGDANWSTSIDQFTASVGNEARTGYRVMVLDVGSGNRWPRTSSYVPIEEGRTYRLSAWFKVATGTTGNIGFVPRLHHADGTSSPVVGSTSGPTVEDGWTRHTFDWTCDYDGAYQVQFAPWAGSQADSILWVDDFTAYDITEAKAAQDKADAAQAEAEAAHEAAGTAWDHADAAMSRAGAAETNAKQHADNMPKMLGGTGGPVGTAPNGSVWFRRDSNNTVTGRWERINGSWVQQEVSGEIIDNLEAGKITALHTEFAESVIGKLWTQLAIVDRLIATSAWIGGAMIGEDAVEAKHITASESLSAKVAEFLKLSVADLVATGAQVDDAVINKLWVDGLVGLSATLARATVASLSLIPHPLDPDARDFFQGGDFGINSGDPSIWIQGRYTATSNGTIRLEADQEYRFAVDVAGSVAGTRYYIDLDPQFDASVNFRRVAQDIEAGTKSDWVRHEIEFTVADSGEYAIKIWANHTRGTANPDGYQWFRNMRLTNMLDGNLIVEDTIRTRHLHVTKDMVGEFASFMHLVTDRMDANALWADRAWLTAVEAASVRLRSVVNDWQTILSGHGMEVISPEGQPTVQLGNFEETGLTLYQDGEATASIADDGHMSGKFVSANEEFYYQGTELSEILDLEHMPRGVVAQGETSSQIGPFFKRTGLAYLQFLATPGRLYKATISGMARANGGGTSTGTYISAHVRHTAGVGSGWPNVTVNSDQEAGSRRIAYHPQSGSYRGFEYSFYWTYPNPELVSQKPTRILFALEPLSSGAGAQLGTGVRLAIEDVGLLPEEGIVYSMGGSDGGTSPAPAPTPEPKPKTRRTKTYGMSWWRTWWQNGNIPSYGVGVKEAAQGRSPYFTNAGLYRSMIGFPSMTSDLSGADIEKIEVRVRVIHSHASSGGNVRLGTHNKTSRPSSYSSVGSQLTNTSFGRGQERWVTLPSSTHAGFKSGSLRGVTMYASSTSSTYYVQANPSRFAIRVTYRK